MLHVIAKNLITGIVGLEQSALLFQVLEPPVVLWVNICRVRYFKLETKHTLF